MEGHQRAIMGQMTVEGIESKGPFDFISCCRYLGPLRSLPSLPVALEYTHALSYSHFCRLFFLLFSLSLSFTHAPALFQSCSWFSYSTHLCRSLPCKTRNRSEFTLFPHSSIPSIPCFLTRIPKINLEMYESHGIWSRFIVVMARMLKPIVYSF